MCSTGVTFTVTPSAGSPTTISIINSAGSNMQWFARYPQPVFQRNSTAGLNMGFTANQGPVATLVSDTAIDLGVDYVLLAETADASRTWVCTDGFSFDSDSALHVTTNSVAVVVRFKVTYELL